MIRTLCSACLLSAVLTSAASAKTIDTLDDFQQWAQARMLCQQTPYTQHESDWNFNQVMSRAGLTSQIMREGGPKDAHSYPYFGTIKPGRTPVYLYGFRLLRIEVGENDHVDFNVYLRASMQDVLKLIHTRQLDRYPQGEQTDGIAVFSVAERGKPVDTSPFGIITREITIRNTGKEDTIHIQCREFFTEWADIEQ